MGRAAYRRRWNQQGGVLLLSFPKAGRTWLRMMLGRALTIHAGLADQAFVDILDLPKLSPGDPAHIAFPRRFSALEDTRRASNQENGILGLQGDSARARYKGYDCIAILPSAKAIPSLQWDPS